MISIDDQVEEFYISNKLDDEEIENLRDYIESEKGMILACSVVELWLSEKPDHQDWSKYDTGLICFIKDYNKKAYYFRLYSLVPHQLWEQEIYVPFTYNNLTKNFHYFAGDECNVGFNFAFEEEAHKFYNIFMYKYHTSSTTKSANKRASRLLEVENSVRKEVVDREVKQYITREAVVKETVSKETSSKETASKESVSRDMVHTPKVILRNNLKNQPIQEEESLDDRLKECNFGEKILYGTIKRNKKIEKSKISQPQSFRVVQHVGFNNDQFQVNLAEDDSSLKVKEILAQLKIKSNRKTRAFVADFLKKNPITEEDESKKKPAIVEVEEEEEKEAIEEQKKMQSSKNRLSIANFARSSMMSVKKKLNPSLNNEPVQSVASAQQQPPKPTVKELKQKPEPTVQNEQSILDVLKSEFEKRTPYLNASSDEEESDSEWQLN